MADECHGALDLPTESLDFTHGFSWTLHYNKGIAWNEEQRNADSNFRISYKALSAQLPIWKENHPWLADTYSQCLRYLSRYFKKIG